MRRPFAVIGFTFFVTLFALCQLPQRTVWIVMAVSVVGWIVALAVRRLRREPVLLCSLIAVFTACLVMATSLSTDWKQIRSLDGQTVPVTAHAADLPHKTDDGFYWCLLRTDTVDGQPMRCDISMRADAPPSETLTDCISFTARLYAVAEPPGDRVCFFVYAAEDLTLTPDAPTMLSRTLAIRQYVTRTVQAYLPGTSGAVLTAMLLGDSSAIPSAVYLRMRRCGILHIFSISGFHLTVFAVSLLRFLERRRVSRFLIVPLCSALVLFVMAVTGFPLSCCRAGIMVLLMLIGKLISHRTDALNSLGLALLLMGMQNPFCAGEVGLQLSVLGTVGIVTGMPLIERWVTRIRVPCRPVRTLFRTACATAMASAYITLLTMPITVPVFGAVSLIAPVANALIMPAAEWAMIGSSFGVLLSIHPFLAFICRPVLLLAGLLARYCVAVSDALGALSFASLHVDAAAAGLWLSGTLALIAAAILLRIPMRRKILLTSVLSLLLLAAPAVIRVWSLHDTASVTLLPVGDNAAVLVENGGHTAMIGCGADAAKAVCAHTDRLDWMLLPREAKTVSGGAAGVLRSVRAEHVYVPDRSAATAALYLHCVPEPIPQTLLSVGDGVWATVSTHPDAPAVRLQLYSHTMLMLFSPGCDLSALPEGWLDADILYTRGDIPPAIAPEEYGLVLLQTDGERGAQILSSVVDRGGEAMGTGTLYLDRSGGIRFAS